LNSPCEKDRFLLAGKIIGAHGLKGNLKVYSFAESLSVFKPGSSILVKRARVREKTYEIRWARPHGKTILLSLKGIESRSLAESLIDSELFIEKSVLPELEEGTFYWADIIGLSVFTTSEKYIGQVESIISTGSNDVYVVKDPGKNRDNETLIPALESVVLNIDLNLKTMRIDLPEGL